MKVDVDGLSKAIINGLEEYAEVTSEGVKKAVKKTATECKNNIKAHSPKLTGDYAKGWVTKKEFESANELRISVKNRTDYQLTHLLEYGHIVKNRPDGKVLGSASAHPHIRPAELRAKKDLMKRIEKAVKK